MLLGGLGYTAYAAQMLYLSDYLLYTCALLNGLGASLLWTGQGYGTQSFMSAQHLLPAYPNTKGCMYLVCINRKSVRYSVTNMMMDQSCRRTDKCNDNTI